MLVDMFVEEETAGSKIVELVVVLAMHENIHTKCKVVTLQGHQL